MTQFVYEEVKQRSLRVALQYLSEAQGIRTYIYRLELYDIKQTARELEDAPTPQLKMKLLMLENAKKSAQSTLDSIVRQGYDELRKYFGDVEQTDLEKLLDGLQPKQEDNRSS